MQDESTKVIATVIVPKELASFSGRTLELRLYEYDPLLADGSADLVEKIAKADFSHSYGRPTKIEIEIGTTDRIKTRRHYYLTIFILEGNKRTHIGEKDGKQGPCRVITGGHPRQVTIIFRDIQ